MYFKYTLYQFVSTLARASEWRALGEKGTNFTHANQISFKVSHIQFVLWATDVCVRACVRFNTNCTGQSSEPSGRWMGVCHCAFATPEMFIHVWARVCLCLFINGSHHLHVNRFAILFITCFAYRCIHRLCCDGRKSIVLTGRETSPSSSTWWWWRRWSERIRQKKATHTHSGWYSRASYREREREVEWGNWAWHKFHASCHTLTHTHTLSFVTMGSLIFRFIVIVITIIIWHKYSMNEALYWFTRIRRFRRTLPIQIVCYVGLMPIKFSYTPSKRATNPEPVISNCQLEIHNLMPLHCTYIYIYIYKHNASRRSATKITIYATIFFHFPFDISSYVFSLQQPSPTLPTLIRNRVIVCVCVGEKMV